MNNWQPQGAAITEKYYVFTDRTKTSLGGGGGSTTIRFIDRNTGKEVKTDSNLKNQNFEHASSLYYKWGSNYIQIIDAETGKMWCADISGKPKQVKKSKCGSMLQSSGLGKGSTGVYRQGWTKYGKNYLRAYSGDSNHDNRIEVYSKKKKWLANFDFPIEKPTCEIEDVAVDGNTGDVYAICYNHAGTHSVDFYRINNSVFEKYIKPNSEGSSQRTPTKSAAKKKDANSSTSSYTPSISTYDGVVSTIFFGTIQDDGEGCGVYTVLDLVMTILTIGIGIAALIGISISGIIYLTAGGSVEKTTKAKRRIYEIVIGLAAYVAIFAVLTFLLPEFNPELKACKTLTAEEITARDAASEPTRNSINTEESISTKPSTQESIKNMTKEEANWAAAQAISEMGVKLASKGSGKNPTEAFKQAFASSGVKKSERNHDSCHQVGKSCGSFVSTVVAAAGVDAKIMKKKNFADTILSYMKGGGDPWITIKTPSGWKKGYKARRGDVAIKKYCSKGSCHWHTFVYVYYKGKLRTAEASHCDYYGRISSNSNPTYVFRYNGGSKYFNP